MQAMRSVHMAAMFLFLLICLHFLCASCRNLSPNEIEKIRSSKEWLKFMAHYDHHLAAASKKYGYKNFSCPTLDVEPPKDIHTLAPNYISVVAALGDSLTAANGAEARTLPGVALEYRGVSFSIGGDGNLNSSLTLPNVIKEFNSAVFGASKHVATVNEEWWSQLNVGIPGSRAKDLAYQANLLVERLGDYPQYKDAWKLVTLFIGANDVCASCEASLDPDALVSIWATEIVNAIDILADGLSNTFVNLVNVIMVGELREYEYYETCLKHHERECPCIAGTSEYYNETDLITRKYQQALYDVPKRYEHRSDFTVVLQPFSENVVIPVIHEPGNVTEPDLSFLAPDCFHFSRSAHAAAASYLWNSMLQPIQEKQHTMDPTVVELQCPDPECPYLRTALNSILCSKKH